MPPSRSTKRAYSEPPVDPEESTKKRKPINGRTEVSPSPSDFSSDGLENDLPLAPGAHDYVDYSLMAQGGQDEGHSRPPRQQRWKHNGDQPITDPALVPEGWNADELDLDVNDIDSQVERCLERISDGILPNFFKFRLSQYERRRAARDEMVHSEPAGLSWDIVRRLEHLKNIDKYLSTNGDPDNQLPNVKAIIKAYRQRKLGWSRGWVSYWSKGVQVNTPQKFDADRHKKLAGEYDTNKAWWVEGFPVNISADSQRIGANGLTLWVCHDTGADLMAVPECYIDQLESLGIPVPVHGYNLMDIPGSTTCHKVVEVDVRLVDINNAPLCHWMRIQACVLPSRLGDHFGTILSGPFLRFALYTATCPDGQGHLYVCNNKKELRKLPALADGFVPAGPPFVSTTPAAPDGGEPPRFLLEQHKLTRPLPVQPPPIPLPAKEPSKKGRKKGKGKTP
ncbi:hypothetical protein PCG10_007355 [Penicillium crustosum]|uniref:Uncharacterized protein n=1 Tax=Penicillium crustosum TaxID=36656 RepID=A0A9P5GIX5_PENCR|nr:uncharacterized protein N7487_006475 [Penicillium crustosum]KAF7522635.1 hypothetical protein PCG10_007355 [Penicillium crustosum]KAJ5412116.1 hypothetical protein N7487_006475 [Penicillium crustosum]